MSDIERESIGFAEWIVKQGYHVDKIVDGKVYWFKWHNTSKFPCGTTSDLYTKYEILHL